MKNNHIQQSIIPISLIIYGAFFYYMFSYTNTVSASLAFLFVMFLLHGISFSVKAKNLANFFHAAGTISLIIMDIYLFRMLPDTVNFFDIVQVAQYDGMALLALIIFAASIVTIFHSIEFFEGKRSWAK